MTNGNTSHMLDEYRGQWILMQGDKMIMAAPDRGTLLRLAQAQADLSSPSPSLTISYVSLWSPSCPS